MNRTAVAHDDPEMCKLLIENGADVNAKDEYNSTPLHKAAWREDFEIVKLLIVNGADINGGVNGDRGITPLGCAIQKSAERAAKKEPTEDIQAIIDLLSNPVEIEKIKKSVEKTEKNQTLKKDSNPKAAHEKSGILSLIFIVLAITVIILRKFVNKNNK